MTNRIHSENSLFIDASNQWDSLDITNDFIFGKVMQNPELCRKLIESILNITIDHLTYPEIQKQLIRH